MVVVEMKIIFAIRDQFVNTFICNLQKRIIVMWRPEILKIRARSSDTRQRQAPAMQLKRLYPVMRSSNVENSMGIVDSGFQSTVRHKMAGKFPAVERINHRSSLKSIKI
jgi:hypothetical protein